MKKKLIVSLTLLALVIAACGGQTTQTTPEPAAPTQAESQPTPVPATIQPHLQLKRLCQPKLPCPPQKLPLQAG